MLLYREVGWRGQQLPQSWPGLLLGLVENCQRRTGAEGGHLVTARVHGLIRGAQRWRGWAGAHNPAAVRQHAGSFVRDAGCGRWSAGSFPSLLCLPPPRHGHARRAAQDAAVRSGGLAL